MRDVLTHMNSAVSYFGDESMSKERIDELTEDIFDKFDEEKTGQLTYAEYMHAVAEHPILVDFISHSPDESVPAGGAGK